MMDLTTNFVVIGEFATAAGLTAVGFVVGPFVYLGHEMVWDRFGSPEKRTEDLGRGRTTDPEILASVFVPAPHSGPLSDQVDIPAPDTSDNASMP